jgi:hypothetical protein
MKFDEIVEMWRVEIWEYDSLINPGNRYDWTSLAVGWALGKGYSDKQAFVIASKIQEKGFL